MSLSRFAPGRASPGTIQITRQFEELPLLTKYAGGERLYGALIDGQYEVTVMTADGEWWISDLWISVDNGKMGTAARGELIHLDADDDQRLYLSILDSLREEHTTAIEEDVERELAELGIRAAA